MNRDNGSDPSGLRPVGAQGNASQSGGATSAASPDLNRLSTGKVEELARALWFDFVDQHGYPNGLPTWDELPEKIERRVDVQTREFQRSLAEAAIAALHPQPQAVELDRYDAGLLGDGGGGDVEWWQDYLRSELERAHEFYQDQLAALPSLCDGGINQKDQGGRHG